MIYLIFFKDSKAKQDNGFLGQGGPEEVLDGTQQQVIYAFISESISRKVSKYKKIPYSAKDDTFDRKLIFSRLVSYVEKVRKLQEAADVIDSIPRSTETSVFLCYQYVWLS